MPILIQGHIDMVTEKNADKNHDFENDPIRFILKGEWLHADGTTLGADNGIGVCAALSLLESSQDCCLPPLECLFTVDEETGLTGARGLDPATLGITAKTLLNLDTEEWGAVYIGCAGGGDSTITVPVERHNHLPQDSSADFTFRIHGLVGGHSGINIHENRGNAVQLLAKYTHMLMSQFPMSRLVHVVGGDKRNAIARESSAVIRLPTKHIDEAMELVASMESEMKAEYAAVETALQCTGSSVGVAAESASPMSRDSSDRLLTLLRILPHGVIRMSDTLKDPEVRSLTYDHAYLHA